jgi:hypothetical protein
VKPFVLGAPTVVLDPYDDAVFTRAALHAHDVGAGRVTVHPAPGTAGTDYLAHDILAALGGGPVLPGKWLRGREPVWEAAAAWLLGLPVVHLTVLRAHLLTAGRWERLLTLWQRTGVQLTLVCHRPGLPAAMEAALSKIPYRTIAGPDALRLLAGGQEPVSPQALPLPARPAAGRWITLPLLGPLGTSRRGRACSCTPAPVDPRRLKYRPRPSSGATAVEVASRIRTATAHPRLAAALAVAASTGASWGQLTTARTADYDDAGQTLALHDRDRQRQGCASYPVPAWARSLLRAAVHFQRMHPSGTGSILLEPGEFSTLLDIAEAVRLRPPQPAGSSSRRATSTQRAVDWFYLETVESQLQAQDVANARRSGPVRRSRLAKQARSVLAPWGGR